MTGIIKAKRKIALITLMVMAFTIIFSMVVFAGDPVTEAKKLKDNIISLLKQIGISVGIIMIGWIGFGMLFGGGTDLSKYKIQGAGLFIALILIFKAESIGTALQNWLQ